MNTPVTFPIAKLLKEKMFKEPSTKYYWFDPLNRSLEKEGLLEDGVYTNNSVIGASAPTIAEVVCWNYSKYNIWIQVSILKDDEWYYSIRRKENNWEIEFPTKEKFSSIEKAYEKGIEIVLNTYSPTS